MTISVVIVHWNTPDLLRKQLEVFHNFLDWQVIVVDNASSKDVSWIKKDFATVKVICNTLNKGFSFGCNQGLLHATADWVLFLNPDVAIDQVAVKAMISFADASHLDAVSPNFESQNYRKPVPSFLSLLTEFSPLSKFIALESFSERTLVGGCLLIKRAVIEKIGGWDARFFLWFEDSDLTRRLSDDSYKYGFVDNLKMVHQGEASFSKLSSELKRSIFFLSLRLYCQKHFSRIASAAMQVVSNRFANNRLLPQDPEIVASIVVPNIKEQLLSSFLQKNSDYFDFKKHELIVVTSTSNLNSFKSKYPEVIFIQLQKRLGFAATVNLGLQRCRGKYLGTVNDDTILTKNWLEKLIDQFDSKTASVSPLILKPNHQLESQGINVLPFGRAVTVTTTQSTVTTDAFNGACVLFSRTALETVGLFDQKFQSYLEDIDLGLRFQRAGWKNKAINTVEITHIGQQSSSSLGSFKNWLDVQNWWFVMLKNFSIKHWLKNFGPILAERARNLSGYIKSL